MCTTYVLLNKSITWYIPFWRLYFCHNKNFRIFSLWEDIIVQVNEGIFGRMQLQNKPSIFFLQKVCTLVSIKFAMARCNIIALTAWHRLLHLRKKFKDSLSSLKGFPLPALLWKTTLKVSIHWCRRSRSRALQDCTYRCTLTPTFFAPSAWHQTGVKDDLSPPGFGHFEKTNGQNNSSRKKSSI